MPQYLHLPDGSGIALKPGEDPKEVWNRAQQLYPDAFGITPKQEVAPAKPKSSGFFSDLGGATENLINIGRTGIAGLMGDGTQAAEEGLARQQQMAETRQSGLDPEKIAEQWNQGNYLNAAGEAVKQVPAAVANLIPSMGQEMSLAALGRIGGGALGSLAGPEGTVAGAQVGQYALPFIVNAIQALGSEAQDKVCLLYTSPSPRDRTRSRMPSSA